VLRTLRHIRGLAVFALLVITGSVPVSIAALLHEGADDACEVRVIVHDETEHSISTGHPAPPYAPHCFICHWLQSVQTVVTTTGFVPPSSGCDQLTLSHLTLARTGAIGQLSARAPPSDI
jgi:hypothetical protein